MSDPCAETSPVEGRVIDVENAVSRVDSGLADIYRRTAAIRLKKIPGELTAAEQPDVPAGSEMEQTLIKVSDSLRMIEHRMVQLLEELRI